MQFTRVADLPHFNAYPDPDPAFPSNADPDPVSPKNSACDYRIITTLLDKPEIGPHIIDAIILDVFRTLYHMSPAHNTADPTPHNQVRQIFCMCRV